MIEHRECGRSTIFENILEQMPGLVGCIDVNHKFTFGNKNCVTTFGFKSLDEMLGLTPYEIRCKAAESAEIWAKQNNEIIKYKTQLTIVDIYPYADGRNLMFLTKKTFLNGDKSIADGVIANCTEITQSTLINLSLAVASTDKYYRPKQSINLRSYKIVKECRKSKLTGRELECLFYLLRGKSIANIGKILKLSPRTIEYYVENVKDKMDCQNKAELIEKAITENFIDVIPESIVLKARLSSVI